MRKGNAEETIPVLLKSLAESTLNQYSTTYKLWWEFCKNHQYSVFDSGEKEVIQFLHHHLQTKKLKFGSFNTYRSALALILDVDFAKQGNMKRYMKGIFRLRPPCRRYNFIWDPKVVLSFLETKFPNEGLSLIDLTKKTATLLALTTGHRIQTLARIKVDQIFISPMGIQIIISDHLKNTGKNKENPCLQIPFFTENSRICPASTLEHYISRTAPLRSTAQEYLFLSTRSPFQTATTESISRWIKYTLSQSGIDTTVFTGYSTRHASTSAAYRNGVTLELIKRTAGWSDSSATFARFYNLPLRKPTNFVKTT